MALANDPDFPVVLSYELRDINLGKARVNCFVPPAVWTLGTGLIADLITIRDNFATALAAATTALIYNASIRLLQTDNAAVQGPSGSNVSDVATLTVNIDSTGDKKAILKIVSPDPDIFVGTTGGDQNVVDKADGAVTAYVEFWTTTDGDFVLSDGETLDDTTPIKSGVRTSRKVNYPKP